MEYIAEYFETYIKQERENSNMLNCFLFSIISFLFFFASSVHVFFTGIGNVFTQALPHYRFYVCHCCAML